MKLEKEPMNVDLSISSTPWTEEEIAALRVIIKKSKEAKKPNRKIKKKKPVSSESGS